MSAQDVKRVINQVLTDKSFRSRFHQDPAAAMQDLDLTDREKTMLQELSITQVEDEDLAAAQMMDQPAIRIGSVYIT